MTDPRIQNLVSIKDPSPTGRTRFAGAWRGNTDGPLHGIVRETVRATEGLLRSAWDVRGNRNLGPLEVGDRLREASGPALKALDGAASRLRAEKAKIAEQVRALSPVKTYEKQPAHVLTLDLRILDQHNALPLGKRAAIEHELRAAPLKHLGLAEALLRLPRELGGIDEQTRADMRVGLLRVFRHDEFEALDTQLDQLQVAESALRHAIEATRETTGNMNDLIEHAPEAFKFSTSAEDAEPVRWTPPATEAVPLVAIDASSDAGAGNAS